MKSTVGIGLPDVQAVYGGAEGDLWELVMGEQIHIGGFQSSMDLAERSGIEPGTTGVDLCCCNGAGMRFLTRFRGVGAMVGVDATEAVVDRGRTRTSAEGMDDRVSFVLADVCETGLPGDRADFVWGEDAWCYVEDKPRLIREAARLVRPGGTIAFTDWVEGPNPMTSAESERFMRFMKFPNIVDLSGYPELLRANGCETLIAENTGRFAPCIDLYLNMLNTQLTLDALKIIGYDMALMQSLGEEMAFAQKLAAEGKLIQAIFVAKKL